MGINQTAPTSQLDVNGNIQISNSTIPMGLMTENTGTTTPLLDLDVNLINKNKNTYYSGATFRIDTKNTTSDPLFQWLYTPGAINHDQNIYLLMQLNSSGELGIGQSPYYPLDLGVGTMRAGKYITASDSTLKTNIQNLTGALPSLLQLQGVTYKFKSSINSLSNAKLDTSLINRTQIGFISQNLGKILPQLIFTDKTGIQSIDYQGVIPVIVEAVKTQQTVITNLQTTITSLQTSNTNLQASVTKLQTSNNSLQATVTSMQNTITSLQAAVTVLQKK